MKMLRICILTCLTLTALSAPWMPSLDEEWQKYKVKHSKTYTGEEEVLRRLIWEKNLKYVEEHNREAEKGTVTFRLAMNKYADMTSEEFVRTMNGLKATARSIKPVCTPMKNTSGLSVRDLPDTVDWRTKGYVTKVKNQGQCGSCWAFSTTGSLEGQHFKKTGKLVSLSESNLVDCSKAYGNEGCKGGLQDYAFTYIIKNGGIDTEQSYPYRPKTGTTCKFDNTTIGSTEAGCIDVTEGSESALQTATAEIGPISVGIDASHESFQLYRDGVYTESKCKPKKLDHGVLVVGYGTKKHIFEKDQDYWLVKNSWGEDWGMEGYIMMARNKDNMCGIATQASYPTL